MALSRRPGVRFLLRTLLLVVLGTGGVYYLRAFIAGDETSPVLLRGDVIGQQCWIFTHLQKCGGSTIKHILDERWGTRNMIYDTKQWKAGENATAKFAEQFLRRDKWDVTVGAYTEALRPYVGDSCKWFTMFRHPVSRLVSAYFYCKEYADTACASTRLNATEADLVTFAKHWGNFGLRQFALAMVDQDDALEFYRAGGVASSGLSGGERRNSYEAGWYILKRYLETEGRKLEGTVGDESNWLLEKRVMDKMLQPVYDLLRDNFTAVGILESFDDTLELYNRALEMPRLEWHSKSRAHGHRNAHREYKTKEEAALAEAWTNSEIKKYIQLDLLIYEHAVAVFNEQKRLHSI